jgi:hypothetical protein
VIPFLHKHIAGLTLHRISYHCDGTDSAISFLDDILQFCNETFGPDVWTSVRGTVAVMVYFIKPEDASLFLLKYPNGIKQPTKTFE